MAWRGGRRPREQPGGSGRPAPQKRAAPIPPAAVVAGSPPRFPRGRPMSAGPAYACLVQSSLGRWSVPVPWKGAEELRVKLRRRGLGVTLCLKPEYKEAWLEPWAGVDREDVLATVLA